MKPKFNRFNTLVAVSAMAGFSSFLSAQIVWDGDTSTDFSDGFNWAGDTAPTAAETADFNGAATNQPALTAPSSVLGVDFQTGGWTLSGTDILSVGANGVTSTGNNSITAEIAATGSTYSSAAGGQLDLDTIGGGTVTFGSAGNTGNVVLNGTTDNDSFSPVVAFGTVILNKDSTTGSAIFNTTVDAGATIRFGSNISNRAAGGGRGQIYGTASVNGTLDLNGQGTTRADNFNWSMGGLNGSGTITNSGSGSAQLAVIAGGSFGGTIQDGTSSTALYVSGGNFNLSGNTNTYSGGTTIDGTELNLGGGTGTDRLGSGVITLENGGYLKNNNSNQTLNNDVVLGAGGGGVEVGWTNRNIRINGDITGDGDFHVRNDSSAVRLTGNNTYTGDTLIQGSVNTQSGGLGTGVVTLDDADGGDVRGFLQNFEEEATLANDIVIAASGGRMKAGWSSDLILTGAVSGAGELRIAEDSGTVALSGNSNTFSGDIVLEGGNSRIRVGSLESGSYAGVISGAGTVDFAGSGTQTLTATSTYTGTTTVSSGTLDVQGDISSSSSITVAAGAAIGGSGTGGNLHFADGGLLDAGLGTITLLSSATLSFADFGFDDLVNSSWMTDGEGTYTLIAGDFTLDSTGLQNFGAANALDRGDGFEVYFDEGSLVYTVVAIPEPGVALLSGLSLLALLRRRRA